MRLTLPRQEGRHLAQSPRLALLFILALTVAKSLPAQDNPVPFIFTISPVAVAPGGADFTLTVLGTGFVNGASAIYWNGTALPDPTTCTAASPPQLASCTVNVGAANIAVAGTASITVVTPNISPAVGTSNVVFLPITSPSPIITTTLTELGGFGQNYQYVSGAIADFNMDGKLDLAIGSGGYQLNVGDEKVLIFLGDVMGSFARSPSSPDTGYPVSIAVGDFNADAKPDLAIADSSSNSMTILLGDGTGNFTPTPSPPLAGSASVWIAVGDFNADGKLDLAVTTSTGVTILLGDGTGNFTATATLPDAGSGQMAVGDFDADGNLDLAVTNSASEVVTILLGDGTGNFTPAASAPSTDTGPTSVAVGDFNSDGKLDLVVTNRCAKGSSCTMDYGTFTIMLGDGTGGFTSTSFPLGGNTQPSSVAVGDLNGDGKLDFVESNASNSVTIVRGDGTGNFTVGSPRDVGGYTAPVFVALRDFNGDGALDIFTVDYLIGYSVLSQTPRVAFAPLSLTFASQLVGTTSAAQTFTLTDWGSATLTITDISLAGTNAADFSQTNDCGTNVEATKNCTINVGFSPTALGTRTATLTITDSAPGSPHKLSLTGTGLAATVSLSAASLTFGNQLVGTTSAPQTVTLSVDGPLTFNSFAISSEFSQTTTCGATLAAGGSCPFVVKFAPTSGGAKTGTLTINDNAGNSPQTVALSGTALQPAVSLAPSSLAFADQIVATTSASQDLTLTNSGNSTLHISGIRTGGDFAQTNTCGPTLEASAACHISVTFAPTAISTRDGAITVTDDAPGSPQGAGLSGNGVQPLVSLSPVSLTFPSQFVGTTGLPLNVTLTNTGDFPLTISNVSASADFAPTNGCTTSVAPGVGCTISVFFDPSVAGARTGTLTITDNAPGSPHTVALSGTGMDFGFSTSSPSSTVSAGQTASYLVSVAPQGGFNQSVALTCTGAPALSTCSISPGAVTLDGTASTDVTVTVTTTAGSSTLPGSKNLPPGVTGSRWMIWAAWLLGLAMLAAGAVVPRFRGDDRRWAPLRTPALQWVPLTALVALMFWTACGGGGSVIHNPGTPAGTYSLAVTGSAASGTSNLNHNISLSLTVR